MFKYLSVLGLSLVLILVGLTAPSVFAQEQFASSYKVVYDVSDSGETEVTENIIFRNLTDKYYASSFTLAVGATSLYDVVASDTEGPLETEVQSLPTKSQVVVKFKQQVVGIDKNYKWTIKFKSKDFTEFQGKVRQVSVPKAPVSANDEFDLTLAVPVSFGDPSVVTPNPISKAESGGKIRLNFNKSQIQSGGVLAIFGTEQLYNFDINYQLANNSFLPSISKVFLPPDTNFQEVLINSIDPKPENVLVDGDGNYLAYFKLDKRQKINIAVSGVAKLHLLPVSSKNQKLTGAEIEKYLVEKKYWEVNNPVIKGRLSDIFKETPASRQDSLTNQEKARLIDQYVASVLTYDAKRASNNDFSRLSALTVLNNPDKALDSEFADLFVTLARSAGVPARRIEGSALTSNNRIRPLTLNSNSLHAWAEYYDSGLGWVMVDPTWENTNSGVNYFSRFDLNHLVVSRLGLSSDAGEANYKVDLRLSDGSFNPTSRIKLSLGSPDEILAGFPITFQAQVENLGNMATSAGQLVIKPGNLTISNGMESVWTSELPPFGKFNYSFQLLAQNLLTDQTSVVEVRDGDESASKQVLISPFYKYSMFLGAAIGLIFVTILLYVVSLGLHLKNVAVSRKKKAKEKTE